MDTGTGNIDDRDGIAADLHEWAAVFENLGGLTKAALAKVMKPWRAGKTLANGDAIIAYFDEGISMEQTATILEMSVDQLRRRLPKMPVLRKYRRADKRFPRGIAWAIRGQMEVESKRKPSKPVVEKLPEGFILLSDALTLFTVPPEDPAKLLTAARTAKGQEIVNEQLAQTIAKRLNQRHAPVTVEQEATAEQKTIVPAKLGVAALRAAHQRVLQRQDQEADAAEATPPVGNFVRPGVYRRTGYLLARTVDDWEARNILGLRYPEDVMQMMRARPVAERAQIVTVESPSEANPLGTERRWWREEIQNIAKRKPVRRGAAADRTDADDRSLDDRDNADDEEFELPIRRSASR